jgi:hypothetical protein
MLMSSSFSKNTTLLTIYSFLSILCLVFMLIWHCLRSHFGYPLRVISWKG